MYNQNRDFVNMRMTFGVCRDFECNTGDIEDMQPFPLSKSLPFAHDPMLIAPINYYSRIVTLNSIPKRWFEIITAVDSEPIKKDDQID